MNGPESAEVAKGLGMSATITREGRRLFANAYHALGSVMSWHSVICSCSFAVIRVLHIHSIPTYPG